MKKKYLIFTVLAVISLAVILISCDYNGRNEILNTTVTNTVSTTHFRKHTIDNTVMSEEISSKAEVYSRNKDEPSKGSGYVTGEHSTAPPLETTAKSTKSETKLTTETAPFDNNNTNGADNVVTYESIKNSTTTKEYTQTSTTKSSQKITSRYSEKITEKSTKKVIQTTTVEPTENVSKSTTETTTTKLSEKSTQNTSAKPTEKTTRPVTNSDGWVTKWY